MRAPRAAVALGWVVLLAAGCALREPRVPAWQLPPPPPVEAPVTPEGAVHQAVLDNGLHVVVLEDRRLPRVTLAVTVRRGAGSVPPERAGLAAYTAELLRRGAGARDALAFAESVDALGARFGASAGWDSLRVEISGLSRDRDALLDLLVDAVLRPRFEEAEARRAREEALAALERAKDDPATLAVWHAARAVYSDHRYGLPLDGTPETVSTLGAAAARAFHSRVFVPDNAVVSAAGDLDPDALVAALRERFGEWEPGEAPDPGPPPPAQAPPTRRIVVVDRPDLGQARIVVAHEGIARTDDDRIPVSLLNAVLGGSGFSSRLMTSLRAESGLTYGVRSGYSLRRAPGPFSVSTFTRGPEVRRAVDIVLAELRRARDEPPGEDELSWARTYATGRFSMGLETSEAVVAALVDLDVYGLPEDSLDTYRSRVRAVSPEQVARGAHEHLHPERAAIVLVGPADALVPQVEDLGEVEVVRP